MLNTPIEKLIVAVAMIAVIGIIVAQLYLTPEKSTAITPADFAKSVSGKIAFTQTNSTVTIANIDTDNLIVEIRNYPGTSLALVATDVGIPGISDNITIYSVAFNLGALAILGEASGLPDHPGNLVQIVSGNNNTNISFTEMISTGDAILIIPKPILYYSNSTSGGRTVHTINLYVPNFTGIIVGSDVYTRKTLKGKYNIIITQQIEQRSLMPIEKTWISSDSDVSVYVKNQEFSSSTRLFHISQNDAIVITIYVVAIYVSFELIG